MRILFVIGDLIGGGSERAVVLLANEFVKRNHDVAILCFPNNDKSYPLDNNVRVIKRKKYNDPIRDLFLRSFIIRRTTKKEKPDVVVSFTTQKNVCTLMAFVFSKTKTIICERNDPNRDPKNLILRLLRKLLYRFSTGFVFQTTDACNYFPNRIRNRSTVIPNSLNVSLPSPHIGERTRRIVTVARLYPEKNIFLGIEAFETICKTHADYVYEIYGDGPCRKELQDHIEKRGLSEKVFLKGFVEDLFGKIKDAAAFIFPSNYEGISNALMEALALGIPCVSTDHPIGGARLLIKDGVNGFLVPVGDANAMANKLEWIIAHPSEASALGENARSILSQSFNVTTIGTRWEEYIKKIVEQE